MATCDGSAVEEDAIAVRITLRDVVEEWKGTRCRAPARNPGPLRQLDLGGQPKGISPS